MSVLNILEWKFELAADVDKSFILEGIHTGFSIADRESAKSPVNINNH